MIPAGKITFLRYCNEELSRIKERDRIGLLSEKRLHSVLKRWVLDDFSCHERKIPANDGTRSFAIADVLTPSGEIAEIQTGSLYPLQKKIAFYMEKTNHPVTVVHPLAAEKYVSWLNPETGEVTARNRSPKKETPFSALGELKPFLPYLGNPRFSVWFASLSLDEYRLLDGWNKTRKRGAHRYEQIPMDLLGVTVLRDQKDYCSLFPEYLPSRFTAKEFAKATHLRRGYGLYDVLTVFCALGVLRKERNSGKSFLYERNG